LQREIEEMKIFIVSAIVEYEASYIICAFKNCNDASLFVDKCVKYDNKRPVCPEIADTNFNNKAWDIYNQKFKYWESRHPAKYYGADFYRVHETDLIDNKK
jgi:hypothetical protein